jgi:arylsulfatase A-like enzyme
LGNYLSHSSPTDSAEEAIFASDNGPFGETAREFGNLGTPDMGNSGPFRDELGEATEGSIRTFAFIRWPDHVPANSSSYAIFSIMDFMPTLAPIVGGKMPIDRPIDEVDQTDVLVGKSAMGHRERLLTFIQSQLVAERSRQFQS